MPNRSKPKRYKTLLSWFANENPSSESESGSRSRNVTDVTKISVNDNTANPLPDNIFEECPNETTEVEENDNVESLERDPGIRRPICSYPFNDHEHIRRAYVVLGPCQPKLDKYLVSYDGSQGRRFNFKWFKDWPWLEYSIKFDKVYCFPYFLFDTYPSHHPSFTEDGCQGWKNVNTKQSRLLSHVGDIHNANMYRWEVLRNPTQHIERVINTKSSQDRANHRLCLVVTIEVVRLLAQQGQAFRGHDESVGSFNSGNFNAVVNSYTRISDEIRKVVSQAPGNAKYISPTIQKKILNILGNKVRAKIREEIGDAKFCVLADESVDVSKKEQMAIILRFVDRVGLVRERFFKVTSVSETSSLTLKNEITKVLAQYDLLVENMRGQGYDGASNMKGKFHGLQALFLAECPYAYYVHCFAHHLQLTLNVVASGVKNIWEFFSMLNLIVKFVDSSAKRHSMLKTIREEEIAHLVAAGTNETGSGCNQSRSLQRAGATRWSSHLRSISSLISLFEATRITLAYLVEHETSNDIRGGAQSVGKHLKNFDFVFCLLLMHDVMKITDFLCHALQQKAIDILNALNFLSITKSKLQEMRENGWVDLIKKVELFCEEHDVFMPEMSDPYMVGSSPRMCQQRNFITNEHYYRVNILNVVIDLQLTELDNKFTETSLELLVLCSTFDPRNSFEAFNSEHVCCLALKFYPRDFTSMDLLSLDMECEYFLVDIQRDIRFNKTTTVSDFCRRLVETGKSAFFPMIYRLICLVLTLPVSTATTERAFSCMKYIKNELRNKMEDVFLDDLMLLRIEKEYADDIDNDYVITEFEVNGPRRVKFS